MSAEWLQNPQYLLDEEVIPFTSLQDVGPVTPMQRKMLRSSADSDFYVASFSWQLSLQLSDSQIGGLWKLQKRHQILRTTFVAHADSGFAQIVFPAPSRPQSVFSTSKSVSGIKKGFWAIRSLQRKHDLISASCPLRFDLITVDGLCHVLVWSWNHALFDRWSQALIYQHLEALLEQRAYSIVDGTSAECSFVAYARLEATLFSSKDSWYQYLADATPPYLRMPRLQHPIDYRSVPQARVELKLD